MNRFNYKFSLLESFAMQGLNIILVFKKKVYDTLYGC